MHTQLDSSGLNTLLCKTLHPSDLGVKREPVPLRVFDKYLKKMIRAVKYSSKQHTLCPLILDLLATSRTKHIDLSACPFADNFLLASSLPIFMLATAYSKVLYPDQEVSSLMTEVRAQLYNAAAL